MTNAEKFKEVFGFEINEGACCVYEDNCQECFMDRYREAEKGYDCTEGFWQSEYKEPNDTFVFGQENKVALLINLDENIYKTIKRGFLDTFEIRDVREAIINGKKVVGEVTDKKEKLFSFLDGAGQGILEGIKIAESDNNAKWKEAFEKIKDELDRKRTYSMQEAKDIKWFKFLIDKYMKSLIDAQGGSHESNT